MFADTEASAAYRPTVHIGLLLDRQADVVLLACALSGIFLLPVSLCVTRKDAKAPLLCLVACRCPQHTGWDAGSGCGVVSARGSAGVSGLRLLPLSYGHI